MSAADLSPAIPAGHSHDAHGHDAHGHGHDHDHAHVPNLAHHFESHEQQFDAGKFGIWLFLVTEVLFFSGLFCAYVIYRTNHPDIFVFGHQFLNKTYGAINTVVLLFSSLTMALAVRCAQKGQRTALIINLVITLLCAATFMGIKYIEYTTKFREGLYPAYWFHPTDEALEHLKAHAGGHSGLKHAGDGHGNAATNDSVHGETSTVRADDPAAEIDGHTGGKTAEEIAVAESTGATERDGVLIPDRAGIFFSIYFCITGLHGIHIIAGMIALTWILVRSIRGDFTPEYFGPVDYVGLYWHLVDLIWIYLFPLLYLIH